MATWVQRAQSIIEGVTDAVPTATQQQRIAERCMQYRPDLAELIPVDPENPTNEEKAQVFVTTVRQWGQSWLRLMAEKEEEANNDAAVTAAGDTAVGDL